MNKKGFTLIEVLAVTLLLAIVATLASVSIVNLFTNAKTNKNELQNEIISEAACLYLELEQNKDLKATCLKDGCDITTKTLIDNEILDEKDVDNPKVIHIYTKDKQKVCIVK